MTRLFLPVLLIGLLVFSCKKKEATETAPEPEEKQIETPKAPDPAPQEPKDEIVQHVFAPAKDISSVRFFTTYYSVCTNLFPAPDDSSASYELDMNGDQVADFRFTASHNRYTGNTYCGHCYTHDYRIIVEALLPEDSIAYGSSSTKILKESDIIGPDTKTWRPVVAPLLVRMCPSGGYWDFAKGYMAVKVGKSFGYIHIDKNPNNGVLILDYGINKTENRPIACGQK